MRICSIAICGRKIRATGKPRLPWFAHIFGDNGTVFENFYTRGISLSAPSWSMLDTGQHTIIRGNAEYDRYTGEVYDYLNFFPFYLGYARGRASGHAGHGSVGCCRYSAARSMHSAIRTSTRAFNYFSVASAGPHWSTRSAGIFHKSDLLATLEHADAPSFEE